MSLSLFCHDCSRPSNGFFRCQHCRDRVNAAKTAAKLAAAKAKAKPVKVSKSRELSCNLPTTTKLKLFEYPHKFGGKSWCVGFEQYTHSELGNFVSQTFLTEWSEDYEHHLKHYKSWQQAIGAE